jgi:hypothetical protein
MGLERAKGFSDINEVKMAHMRVINTLIEAMCDHCLTVNWRKQCFRYVKLLMPLLYEILDEKSYKQKVQDIQILYAYYFVENQIESKPINAEKYWLPLINKRP